MKLNPDCVRAILLFVEDKTDLDTPLVVAPYELPNPLRLFPPNEVMYHIKQAELSGLITACNWFIDGSCLIKYLTPEGHQFVGNIRSSKLWDKVKTITKDAGVNTLPALIQIATNVALSAIQAHL